MKIKCVTRFDNFDVKVAQKVIFEKMLKSIFKKASGEVIEALILFGIELSEGEHIQITISKDSYTANIFTADGYHAVIEE